MGDVKRARFAASGRPREFDADEALDRAMRVFWSRGYEGASLIDLTQAMRINRPSLYAAFGDKESLFRRVVNRYVDHHASHVADALEKPTARAVVEALWRGGVELVTGADSPGGCLLVQGALACGTTAKSVQRELVRRRGAGEAALRSRFERAISEGDLPRSADPASLARYAATVSYGLAVQAAGGASRRDLREVVEIALRCWPK
jgi:AcrR family transcriptional regulator